MRFDAPLFLLALLAVPALWALWAARRRKVAARLARLSRQAVAAPARSGLQTALLLGALAALSVALAGPRWGRGAEERVARGRNLMLAVDVSRSMLAEDVRPNRLGRAKADLIDLVDALRGDRAGLLAFRGKGALLCPMTTDAAFLRQAIDALAPDSAPPGETDLADAIAKCLAAFDQAQSDHNAIVLVSDGEDLAGRAEALAKEAGARGIPIFAVGIGSAQGAAIPTEAGELTYQGQAVRSRLTESTLRAIAEASGGAYVPLATAGTAETTLGAVYARHLSRLAAEEERTRVETAFVDRTPLFASVAALLVVAAGCLSLGRVSVAAVLVCLLGTAAAAQEPARAAQRAYREGRYAEAAAGYAKARAGAEASQNADLAFNEALALWKAGDPTNALDRVRQVLGAPELAARAATLEGTLLLGQSQAATNAAQRLTLRREAADAFARALRAEPSDAGRRNLARALEGLPALAFDARREAALRRHQGQGLRIVPEMLARQRALMRAVPEVFASPTPGVRLAQAERLAADVRAQADRWFPVLDALPQAVTNETLRADLLARAQSAQAALDAAAEAYAAVEGDAAPLVAGEPFLYDLWKTIADPPMLNAEAIAVHTNAFQGLPRYQPARDDLPEVLALTQQFRLLFPQWAEEQLKQAAASTNETAFTAADRDLIARTADAIVPLLSPPVSDDAKRRVMEALLLIRDHLPKPPAQPPPKRQPPPEQPPQQQQQPSEGQPPPDKQPPPQPSEQEREDQARQEDLQALLQKAADREREHEAEKRAASPRLPPSLRDW